MSVLIHALEVLTYVKIIIAVLKIFETFLANKQAEYIDVKLAHAIAEFFTLHRFSGLVPTKLIDYKTNRK